MNIDEYYTTHCVRCSMTITANWDASDNELLCVLCEIEMDPTLYIPTPDFTAEQEAEYDEYLLASIGVSR